MPRETWLSGYQPTVFDQIVGCLWLECWLVASTSPPLVNSTTDRKVYQTLPSLQVLGDVKQELALLIQLNKNNVFNWTHFDGVEVNTERDRETERQRERETERKRERETYKQPDCHWCKRLTRIFLSNTGSSKFGIFFVFSRTGDSITEPMHSNSIEGDVTLVNWYFFMFLTPQQRT